MIERYYLRADEIARRICCSPSNILKYDREKDRWHRLHSESEIEEILKSIPHANVREEKKSEWIIVRDEKNNTIRFKCLLCNNELDCILPFKQTSYEIPYPREKYCSNCGAYMQKEVEE